ncbi:ABC transporter permease [Mucilaginibacter sp. BJC16-A38]|uniref:ABC transporter permease n=1 Tax=Mucilaginibacter phenanthrenivorans TaxID=1234842 RepID=UPI002157312C|nr:ABC transporter permease [Mucilaginibacter phenanthrenivorans]MCR8556375.1 ABC transporter permease [Mucilaginibacter phenanthrenivorans]
MSQSKHLNAYTFHITLYDLALQGTVFIGLTFILLMWFTKKVNRAANRFLGLALGVVVLWMVWVLCVDIRLTACLPHWSWLPLQFSMALGPLIFFYVLKVTRPEYKLLRKDLLHFSPLLLELSAQALEVSDSIKTGAATYDTLIFHQLNPIFQLLAFISVTIYLYLSYRLIQAFYQRLKFTGGDRYRYELRWLHRLLMGFGMLWLLWIPFKAVDYFYYHNQLGIHAYYPLYLLLAAAAIWMAAAAFLREEAGTPTEPPSFLKAPLPAEMKQRGIWLKKAVQAGLYYQDPELSLSLLAQKLELTTHELSRIINTAFKKSFNDFINEYRVRDVAGKMRDPAYDRITLLGMAFDAGFNSKATFIRAFKQLTGKNPAEYKRELEKEVSSYHLQPHSRTRQLILVPEASTWSHEQLNYNSMFRNYLKIAWRNTVRSISYSSINMIGLAAGLCSFIVILLYMNYELSYDKWSPELNKVYHVSLRQDEDFLKNTPNPLAGFLAQKYQNAEAATMLQSSGDRESLLAAGERKIYQKNIVSADSNFLKVFPYKLATGNAATALNAPGTAILTRDLSRKLFGNEDPMGKSIKLNDRADLMVTGVLEDQQGATHLPVGMIIHDPWGRSNLSWGDYSCQTYIKLRRAENDTTVETAINRLYYNDHIKAGGVSFENYTKAGAKTNLFIDQVSRFHNFPKHGSSNFSTVTILLVLAILLLLAGAINFSNLAIAQSISRAKEVGIRKVMGAGRMPLILQFMAETSLQCLASLILAVILLAWGIPYINRSFNIGIGFLQPHEMLRVVIQLISCLSGIILLSGLYPAVYLSKFNAVDVLKGIYSTGGKGTLFRNGLIVVQFMVSVFFITAIIVIKSQLSFMQMKDKGFSADQLMRLETKQQTRGQGFDHTRNLLLSVPGVISVAKTTSVPGDSFGVDTSTIPFKSKGAAYRMQSVSVSTDYFKTLGVSLKKGRLFTDDVQDQKTRSAVINEAAAQKLGLRDPVGEVIAFPGCDSTSVRIVGVVKDFNVQGFENVIQPVVFTIGNHQPCLMQFGGTMLVKLDSRHAQRSIAGITQIWKTIEPGFPLRYSFVDQNFEALLSSYARLEKIIMFFGLVAITISLMGLFALTAFFTRQRTKEVGVRKVLGATVLQLATLLSRDFIYLVLLSVFIITPFTWWAMQKWLQTFAYRIDISWWIFFVAGVTAIVIAVITVSFQSIKAALANPADSLRSE